MPVDPPALLPTTEHPSLRWIGLTGAATALQVARAATQAPGPVLLVTHDAATAARLEEELAFFCAGAVPVCGFPGYETLPYDQFSPHPDIISQRLRHAGAPAGAEARHRDRRPADGAAAPAAAHVHRRPRAQPQGRRGARSRAVPPAPHQRRLRQRAAGGRARRFRDPRLAVRRVSDGQRVAAAHRPVRRRRSTASAASTPNRSARSRNCARLDLLPAREFSLSPDAIKDFRRRFRTRFEGDLTRMPLYRDVGEGLAPAGIEYYLPLFFEQTATLLDYLPPRATVLAAGRPRRRACATPGTRWSSGTRSAATTSSTRCSTRPRSASPPDEWLAAATRAAARAARGGAGATARDGLRSQARRAVRVDFGTAARAVRPHRPAPRGDAACLRRPAALRRRDACCWPPNRPVVASCCSTCCGPTASRPRSSASWQEFLDSRRAHRAHRRAARLRRRAARPGGHDLRRGAAVRRARAPGTAPAAHRPRSGEDHPAARGPASGRAGRARGLRRRPLPRPHDDGRGRHARPSSWCSSTPAATSSTCRCRRSNASAATPARRPSPRRCTSSAATSGRRRARGRRRRSATRRRNCSTSTHAALRARATPSRVDEQQVRAFEAGFPFEETADQAERDRRP